MTTSPVTPARRPLTRYLDLASAISDTRLKAEAMERDLDRAARELAKEFPDVVAEIMDRPLRDERRPCAERFLLTPDGPVLITFYFRAQWGREPSCVVAVARRVTQAYYDRAGGAASPASVSAETSEGAVP